MNRLAWMLAPALLAGCAMGPQARPPVAVYDFGLQAASARDARLTARLLVAEVTAPEWLAGTAIQYRLAYHDGARPQAYANSRWSAAPAQLLTHRLRTRAAAVSPAGIVTPADGARADFVLRLELEEFSQLFDAPEASRGLLRARASLIRADERVLVAQQRFEIEKRAPSANAEGAVRALAAAGDELVAAVLDWTGQQLAARK